MWQKSPNRYEIWKLSVFLWHTFLQVASGGPGRVLFSVRIAVLHYLRVFLTVSVLWRFRSGRSLIGPWRRVCWRLRRRSVCDCWWRDVLENKWSTISICEQTQAGSCQFIWETTKTQLDSWTRATKPIRGSWGVNCRSDGGGGEAANTVRSQWGLQTTSAKLLRRSSNFKSSIHL